MRIYNTLGRKKEEFIPIEKGKVTMYVCGPTTYNYIHIGNARPMIVFDAFRKYLLHEGYEVTFIQNYTDVDDKIINKAREEGVEPLALSAKYIKEYEKDSASLRVMPATVHPKVSENMEAIIHLVKGLEDKGLAYEAEGDVYFDVRHYEPYGRLSGRNIEDLKSGARVEVGDVKRDPLDFALWKKAKPGEISWDSPWGKGRPGWHIECSAMSVKHTGQETLDIHGGGQDLIFPHHENEVAQSEGYSGKPFVNYWMHNGFITVNKEKMSKSLGNFFLVREVLEKFPGEVIRYFILSTQYRNPIDFNDGALKESEKALSRLSATYEMIKKALDEDENVEESEDTLTPFLAETRDKIEVALGDDFNTALALGHFFEASKVISKGITEKRATREALLLAESIFTTYLVDIYGVLPYTPLEREGGEEEGLVNELMELLVDIRGMARAEKQYAMGDAIRDRLKDMGIELKDSKEGTTWEIKN